MRTTLLASVLLLAACAHTPAEPAVEREAPMVCDQVPALAATRVPRPARPSNCGSKEWRASARAACETDQADACHLLSGCLLADALDLTGEARKPITEELLPLLARSCKAGLAESCTLRAAAQVEAGADPKSACADYIRGAQLGDADGYLYCMRHCLN